MHILFLLTQDLESPGGLGRFWPIARWLSAMGHRVEIAALHPAWSELRQRRFERDGVQVEYVAPMHVIRRGARQQYYGAAQLLWVTMRATLALALHALRSKAEVIHIAKAQPMNGVAGWLASRLRPGHRLFLDYDDYEAATNHFSGAWQQRIVHRIEDWLPGVVRGITVNTTFLAQRCIRLGVPEHRIVHVPNGYEPDRFLPVNPHKIELVKRRWGLLDHPTVLYLGSLHLANHPLLLLLDAFREVVNRVPAARLCLVGGGSDFDRVKAEVQARNLAASVVMPGPVDISAVAEVYAASEVLVDPVEDDDAARSRGPLKIVEALACGVPVVTGAVGDRAAMLANGQAGLLVKPGDASALAGAIVEILNNRAFRAKLAEGARAASSAYRWDALVQRFAQVYAL